MGNENEETGQYYYRARMYSPQQSRFISNDPMGMVDGPNMYAYVRNDPVNARDPSGCMSVPPNLINGGGGSGGTDLEECPGSGYETYNACVNAQHGTPPAGYDSVAEYCSDICYEQESTSTGGGSGGDGSSLKWGEHTRVEARKRWGVPYGYKFEFDAVASESLGTGLAASGSIVCVSIVGGNVAAIPACVAVVSLASIFSYCAAQHKGTRINWNIVTGIVDSHSCIEDF